MLTEVQHRLWETYQQAEGRAPRAEKLHALAAFLDSLADSPKGEWFAWAKSLAEQVVDQGAQVAIRRPLFRRAIFPALLAGHCAGLGSCARWLAGLSEHLRGCADCREQLASDEQTEVGLLRAALRHDPADHLSRRRLVEKMATWLRYTLHEIPSGVLYGADAASPEQCRELEQDLDEFCLLLAGEDSAQRYQDLIHDCRLHFREYRNYLLNRQAYNSYRDYLMRR